MCVCATECMFVCGGGAARPHDKKWTWSRRPFPSTPPPGPLCSRAPVPLSVQRARPPPMFAMAVEAFSEAGSAPPSPTAAPQAAGRGVAVGGAAPFPSDVGASASAAPPHRHPALAEIREAPIGDSFSSGGSVGSGGSFGGGGGGVASFGGSGGGSAPGPAAPIGRAVPGPTLVRSGSLGAHTMGGGPSTSPLAGGGRAAVVVGSAAPAMRASPGMPAGSTAQPVPAAGWHAAGPPAGGSGGGWGGLGSGGVVQGWGGRVLPPAPQCGPPELAERLSTIASGDEESSAGRGSASVTHDEDRVSALLGGAHATPPTSPLPAFRMESDGSGTWSGGSGAKAWPPQAGAGAWDARTPSSAPVAGATVAVSLTAAAPSSAIASEAAGASGMRAASESAGGVPRDATTTVAGAGRGGERVAEPVGVPRAVTPPLHGATTGTQSLGGVLGMAMKGGGGGGAKW